MAGLMTPEEMEQEIETLRLEVRDLKRVIALWRLNGLFVLDTAHAFGGNTGLYGSGPQFARVDHTH